MDQQHEQTTFTLIAGGKSRQPQQRSKPQVPAELRPLFTQLRKHHTAIAQAYQPLKEKQQDLERDWATRDETFWQETLTMLQVLQATLRSALSLFDFDGGIEPSGVGFIAIRYALMVPLYHAIALIDETGIEATSYLPVCGSMKAQHLQQRHRFLRKLQELATDIQPLLDLTGPGGQRQCIEEHERFQQKLAALSARENVANEEERQECTHEHDQG